MVKIVEDRTEKTGIARIILEALPEWFGLEESREEYISECAEQILFADMSDDSPIGFLTLKETGRDTAEIYSFMQAKTVQMGRYPEYDATNSFYQKCGFKEFEVIPTLWDEWNPCQIYVMGLKNSQQSG